MSLELHYLQKHLLVGSTLVEGSTLTDSEAEVVLAGKTVSGHSITEHRELLNYQFAVEKILADFDESPILSVQMILDFHRRLFHGLSEDLGRWKSSPNYTFLSDGQRLDYLDPAQVEIEINRWTQDFNQKNQNEHLRIGAELYHRFQMIHPFEDGNGRIGRVLMAFWFYRHLKKIFHFYFKDKLPHLEALESAGRGKMRDLETFFKQRLK